MAEPTTLTTEATPTTPTEGAPGTTEAAAIPSLLSSTEGVATTQQQASSTTEATATTTNTAEQAAPQGAPEKYEFKAPEGKQYDAAVLEPFSDAAKAANLSQDAAQKILETMAPKLAERMQAQVQAIHTGWLESSKTDAEFGGEKLQENLSFAKKALDMFAPKNADGTVSGYRKLLDDTGLGNNPEVIRVLVRVGKAIGEDGFVPAGGRPSTSTPSTAELLYGKSSTS